MSTLTSAGDDSARDDPAGGIAAGAPGVGKLVGLPPGPQLAAALAEVDPAELPTHDVVLVARAWERLKAHAEAQQVRVFAELA
ncbi:hypothetical protein E1269_31095, partial [Jiangella asiatica]